MAAVVALALVALLVVAAVPAGAVQITATSAAGFPNERTSNDPPGNAIDNNTSTFTWTTESLNTASPSFLAIGFASSPVNRLRILKTPESGGGTGSGVKNLVIQYTTGTGPLPSRSWSNVTNLINGNPFAGFFGSEPLSASSVNANGTVLGDAHDGFASLTFERSRRPGCASASRSSAGGPAAATPTPPATTTGSGSSRPTSSRWSLLRRCRRPPWAGRRARRPGSASRRSRAPACGCGSPSPTGGSSSPGRATCCPRARASRSSGARRRGHGQPARQREHRGRERLGGHRVPEHGQPDPVRWLRRGRGRQSRDPGVRDLEPVR